MHTTFFVTEFAGKALPVVSEREKRKGEASPGEERRGDRKEERRRKKEEGRERIEKKEESQLDSGREAMPRFCFTLIFHR